MKMTLKVSGLILLLFALAGCASQSDNTAALSPSQTATPSPSKTAITSPVALSNCTSSQLSVIDGRDGVAMGNVSDDGVVFMNNSTTPCTLKGYPKLQMINSVGAPITTHLHMGTSYTVQFSPEELITLMPGGEAMFDLGYTSSTGYGSAYCPPSAQVLVTPPHTDQPIVAPWKLQPYGGSTIEELRCGEITVSPVYAPPAH